MLLTLSTNPLAVPGREAAAGARFLWELATVWGLRLAGALIVLGLAWIAAAWVRRLVYRLINRPTFDQTLVRFFSTGAGWGVLFIGIVLCLGVFGINTTSLAAVVGAAGLAIGLALQGSLSNLAAGIMLLAIRPFKVGDTIVVAGQTGRVDEIELFTTRLDTPDNRRVILPNGQIFGAVIENITHHATRRADVVVGVDAAADIDGTRAVLIEAARSVTGGLADPTPEVVLADLGASSVNWRVQVWARTDEVGKVREALIQAVKEGLDQAGIGIPGPQMEVRMKA